MLCTRRTFLSAASVLPLRSSWIAPKTSRTPPTPESVDREVLWYASRCYCCGSKHCILAPRGRHADGTPFMYICEVCKWHNTNSDTVLPMPDDFRPGPGWKLWPLLLLLSEHDLEFSIQSQQHARTDDSLRSTQLA